MPCVRPLSIGDSSFVVLLISVLGVLFSSTVLSTILLPLHLPGSQSSVRTLHKTEDCSGCLECCLLLWEKCRRSF